MSRQRLGTIELIRPAIDPAECRRMLRIWRLGPSDNVRQGDDADELWSFEICEEWQPGTGEFDDDITQIDVPATALLTLLREAGWIT